MSRRALNAGLIHDVLLEPGGDQGRNIFTEESRANALYCIHMNPVRKGLCSDMIEYRWSSARAVLLEEERVTEVDKELGVWGEGFSLTS